MENFWFMKPQFGIIGRHPRILTYMYSPLCWILQNKRSHLKMTRSNVRRSTSEILSSRGARPEDDFHSGMTSSDEDDNYHKPRSGSRPHSGTSATNSPKTRWVEWWFFFLLLFLLSDGMMRSTDVISAVVSLFCCWGVWDFRRLLLKNVDVSGGCHRKMSLVSQEVVSEGCYGYHGRM